MKCVLIVDDHPIIATACRLLLEPVGIENIITVHDAVSGYEAFLEHKPDVVTIDLSLHGEEKGGLSLIKRILADDPKAAILVFSMHADRRSFVAAIECGAAGYLLKDAPPDELVYALQQARSGRRYLDPQLAVKLAFPDTALSAKEKRVLALLLESTPYASLAKPFW